MSEFDAFKNAAQAVGTTLLRRVLVTGAKAAAAAYNSVAEDVETVLENGAKAVREKRQRVTRKADER